MAKYQYKIEVTHEGLNKYRLIQGTDRRVVEQKAAAQKATWDEMWQKKVDKENKIAAINQKSDQAQYRTEEAKEKISELENILNHTLSINDAIDWEIYKDKSIFSKPKPEVPISIEIPSAPKETDAKYQFKSGIISKVFSSRKNAKLDELTAAFNRDYSIWEQEKERTIKENSSNEKLFKHNLSIWQSERDEFIKRQQERNAAIDHQKEQYLQRNPESVTEYCSLVLSNSQYPDYFPQEFDLDYNSDTQILVIDYSLPSVDAIPRVKEVKYVKSKDEFTESFLTDGAVNKIFDSIIYQIALRTVHEIYESDKIDAINSVVFNGLVKSIDAATGHEVTACILSLQAGRDEFLAINLDKIEPKACFKKLKGVGSSKLHSLTPIAPIININREDKRFVSSYDVADALDDSINLAAMDWEDFEHLIRELFEKEFVSAGGEVRVTRASRDGGVDAVAFDPDPIRGGKIVIQAKRYTNTVGVSAVRDLYGTVMNEGATKGILVTTADYGPEAYDFAKGKPLTLLNGGNLLHLLEKHGHQAKIDLKAAKEYFKNQDR